MPSYPPRLVLAAKYAMAHKGVFLPREKQHLATMGFEGEKLVELNFLCGFMAANNQNYVHLISEGLELEKFLQDIGPFKHTVYNAKEEL